jgi:subtilase family serine protease
MRPLRPILPLTIGALALLASTSAMGATAGARSRLPGSAPSWARAQRDRGAAPNAQRIEVKVYLPLRDGDGAQALADQVSDPTSATYGAYLSPAQFRERFAASDRDVAAVRGFLTDHGLRVVDVPANNHDVAATGTIAQVERAFGVDVHRYRFRGRTLNAPTSSLTVPSAIADKVVAVAGVDQSGVLTHPLNRRAGAADEAPTTAAPNAAVHTPPAGRAGTQAPPPDGFRNAPPCSRYYGEKTATDLPPAYGRPQPYAPCGYVPAQLRSAYGVDGLRAPRGGTLDGRGVTVAITDAYAAPTIRQDADTYARRHGQAPFARGQFTQVTPRQPYRYGYDDTVNGDQCGEQGWYGEETLDVEAVHAIAPAAKVTYVPGRSCNDDDLDGALTTIVDRRLADIVSNSWGDVGEDVPPDILLAYRQTFLQAALEGIGVFFSSGDDGDDSGVTDDGSAVIDYPSSDPLVTAVGGTSLGVGANGRPLLETGWATGRSALSDDGTAWTPTPPGDFLYGGGGGVSSRFPEPAYQRGVVPDAVAGGHRATPDVAMVGDPNTGMLVGETQTFPGGVAYDEYRIGGTSLSSPLYAGVEALADQAAGRAHGFANPAIYRAARSGLPRDVAPTGRHDAVVRVDYVNGVDAADGTSTTLRSLDDEAQSLHLARGWDTLTGVGVPGGAAYVTRLGR